MIIGDNPYTHENPIRDFFRIGRMSVPNFRNSEAFFPEFSFAANGQLGIKNANPSAELDVNGHVKIVNGQQ